MSATKPSILVVEDEDLLRSNIQAMLETRGYDVDTAANGQEALDFLGRRGFDLVITDIRMSPVGGVELLTRVSAEQPGTGVVVMTAFTSEAQRYEVLGRGGLRYLEKPFSLEFMANTVAEVLESRSANGFHATLSDIRFAELIQLHCLNRASGRMLLRRGGMQGEVYMRNGRFVHAEIGTRTGQEALIELLSWPGGSCVFERDVRTRQQTFKDLPGDYVLLDSMREIDERSAKPHQPKTAASAAPLVDPVEFLMSKMEIAEALNVLDLPEVGIPVPLAVVAPVEQSLQIVTDPEVFEYLERLGQQLDPTFAAIIDPSAAVIGVLPGGFAAEARRVQTLLRLARQLVQLQSGNELDMIEMDVIGERVAVLRLNIGFLCLGLSPSKRMADVVAALS